MKTYRADLHIHTLLSPCASLEMTPRNIVRKARESGLQVIGITDHNSVKNAWLVKTIGETEGIFVITGAEVTTKEDVHCLVFFETQKQLAFFQDFIDSGINRVPLRKDSYIVQPVIDEEENVLELIPYYLPAALKSGIKEVQSVTHELEGIFIPAHVDRIANGIFGQLGFIPHGLEYDALGVSRHSSESYVQKHYVFKKETTLLHNSDAHYLHQIGEIYTRFTMESISFREIKKALRREEGRFVSWYEEHK